MLFGDCPGLAPLRHHVLSFSLFTPTLGVDSAEADKVGSRESASARTSPWRFIRARDIAAPPPAR
jgi:hypothetical protein